MPELATRDVLEILAQGITAILAMWLGLIVTVRAPRAPATRAFGLLTLFMAAWSVSIIVQRFSPEATVDRVANAIEDIGAFGAIAATPHLAAALSSEGRWSRSKRALVIGGYGIAFLMALPGIVEPGARFAITPPHFELPGLPGEVFGWTWIVVRVAMFGLALAWIAAALQAAGSDVARRRQLQVALVTIGLAALGGVIRFTPPLSDSDRWLGVSLITLSMIMATYAVFAQHIFFSAGVAVRTFRFSVLAAGGVATYVVLLLGLDGVVRRILHVDLPLVTAIGLVATVALFEPVANLVRRWSLGDGKREVAYDRMLRALGESVFTVQKPTSAIEPALARLSRTFRATGAFAVDRAGARIASHGQVDDGSPLVLRLPMQSAGETFGELVLGPKRDALPYASDEVELLGLAATYLAGSVRLAASEQEQVTALDRLSAQRASVASSGSQLHEALVGEAAPAVSAGFRVFAMGPLRVERDGELIRQWGGAKAGTRQAEAMFAFLFDRGERGVPKDEIVELIWPDVDLERADLAFHRTLGGLRTTLEPMRRGGDRGTAISFHNDRYRLAPSVIGWSDVEAFEEAMAGAGGAGDPEEALRLLERARSLYRGEYMDDCPFYGDSSQVEERRVLLRGRFVDLLVVLGERYEARGDRPAAAACFRQARAVADDDLAPAEDGLIRLRAAT